MHYSSGKTRISKSISNEICKRENKNIESNNENYLHTHTHTLEFNKTLVSLFCGGLSVELKLAKYFKNVICNDKQEYLISLYNSMKDGWIPPSSLTEDEYKYIREHKDENKALTAFAGFGCSFGGKWFGGYGRHGTKGHHAKERSMPEESQRALLRDREIFRDFEFTCLDYRDVEIPDGAVVYCDPPYSGKMAAYGIKETFDSEIFWEYMRKISKDHDVFISELQAPPDFVAIWEKPVLRQLANCNADNFVATEKLFVYDKESKYEEKF